MNVVKRWAIAKKTIGVELTRIGKSVGESIRDVTAECGQRVKNEAVMARLSKETGVRFGSHCDCDNTLCMESPAVICQVGSCRSVFEDGHCHMSLREAERVANVLPRLSDVAIRQFVELCLAEAG